MSTHHGRPRWGLVVAAALVIASCKDSTGPQAHLSDPAGFGADLQAVSGVLASPTFQSFGAVGSPGSPVATASRAGTLLRAVPIAPPRTSVAPSADMAVRLQALRRGAASFARVIGASVVPAPLLGTTWVWNATTHAYEQDPNATPAASTDRVRIILYALDPLTGDIAENPLTPIGFVDLVDESTPTPPVDRLHVLVRGGTPATPGTTYVDYTVSGQVTGNPVTTFTATAAGFVSDGTHTLTFTGTFGVTQVDTDNPDIQIDGTWDLNDPAIHVELHETLTLSDADHLTVTITNASITRGSETVSVHGTVTNVLSLNTFTVSLDIDVNSVPWVRIRGTENGLTILHADGSELSAEEDQAFLGLFELPFALAVAITNLFSPCGTLMGA